MEIHFKGTSYTIPTDVSRFAQKKISGLKKYVKRREEVAHVYADLGKETDAHQNGRIWRAELTMTVDGAHYRAVALEESIEAAITKAADELAAEVKDAQKRKQDLARRGGASLKSLIRNLSV